MTIIDTITGAVAAMSTSPWFYLFLAAMIMVDSILPVLPGEAVLVTGGILAGANSTPTMTPIIAAGAIGAVLGGLVSYRLGGLFAKRVHGLDHTSRRGRLTAKIAGLVHRRRSGAIIVAHFLPGGRNVAALVCGSSGYAQRAFLGAATVGALAWAATAAGAGYLGGAVLEGQPLLAFAGSLVVAGLIALVVTAVQHPRRPARVTG